MTDIWLDPLIRDNALLAIFFVSLCANIIRQNLFAITQAEPKIDTKQMKYNNTLARARQLRSVNGKYLLSESFRDRRVFYTKPQTGVLLKAPPSKTAAESMEMQDPTQSIGMMKNQMVFLFSQGAVGYWVNFLFTGFLVGKTPFPLTHRFKSYLQRGVDVDNLEPGYISGLCWYFILMMGISGIQVLLLNMWQGEEQTIDPNTGEDTMMMMMGVAPQANPLMGGPDTAKLFTQEKDALELHYWEGITDGLELELYKNWKSKSKKD